MTSSKERDKIDFPIFSNGRRVSRGDLLELLEVDGYIEIVISRISHGPFLLIVETKVRLCGEAAVAFRVSG